MSVDIINGFLNFDISTKISILVGILSYFIMRVGLSQKDNNLLIILIISFFAFLTDILLDIKGISVFWVVILFACLLRYTDATQYFFIILNCLGLTNKSSYSSTIFEIGNCQDKLAMIKVVLKSGDVLICDDLSLFKNKSPTNPITIDFDGSINLYVTAMTSKDKMLDTQYTKKIKNPLSLDYISDYYVGKNLYYISNIKSSEIEYIQFGFVK